jgi:hypothetical protein
MLLAVTIAVPKLTCSGAVNFHAAPTHVLLHIAHVHTRPNFLNEVNLDIVF